MAKKLDENGVKTLWSIILEELNKKTSKSDLTSLENRVEMLETAEFELYGGSAKDVMYKEDE